MTAPIFRRLALVGIGLIGSSIARGAREKGLAGEIVISTRRAETLERARELGLGDAYGSGPREAGGGATGFFLATV